MLLGIWLVIVWLVHQGTLGEYSQVELQAFAGSSLCQTTKKRKWVITTNNDYNKSVYLAIHLVIKRESSTVDHRKIYIIAVMHLYSQH